MAPLAACNVHINTEADRVQTHCYKPPSVLPQLLLIPAGPVAPGTRRVVLVTHTLPPIPPLPHAHTPPRPPPARPHHRHVTTHCKKRTCISFMNFNEAS